MNFNILFLTAFNTIARSFILNPIKSIITDVINTHNIVYMNIDTKVFPNGNLNIIATNDAMIVTDRIFGSTDFRNTDRMGISVIVSRIIILTNIRTVSIEITMMYADIGLSQTLKHA